MRTKIYEPDTLLGFDLKLTSAQIKIKTWIGLNAITKTQIACTFIRVLCTFFARKNIFIGHLSRLARAQLA